MPSRNLAALAVGVALVSFVVLLVRVSNRGPVEPRKTAPLQAAASAAVKASTPPPTGSGDIATVREPVPGVSGLTDTDSAQPASRGGPRSREEVLALHLQPLTVELQERMVPFFAGPAARFMDQAKSLQGQRWSWDVALAEADARFTSRLWAVCAERVRDGKGLFAIDNISTESISRDRKFLKAHIGMEADCSLYALVVVDPPDMELEALDREYWNMRAVRVGELVGPFNALPLESRIQAVQAFEASRRTGAGDARLLHLPQEHLEHVTIDRSAAMIVPIFR